MSAVGRTSLARRAAGLAVGALWFTARALARTRGSQIVTLGLAVFLVDRGLFIGAALVGVAVVVLVVLPLLDDGTDEIYVGTGVRLSARAWHRYGRRWASTMYAAGLGHPWAEGVPYLVRIRPVVGGDVLVLQTLPGQSAGDITAAVPDLGRLLGAAQASVRSRGPGVVWIEVVYEPAEGADDLDDYATDPEIVVGVTEEGCPWTLQLDTHVLVTGDAGTGTTSVARAIVRGSRPLAAEGWLALWAVDTSGGRQLAGAAPYDEVAFGGVRGAAELLDRLRRDAHLRTLRNAAQRSRPGRGGPSRSAAFPGGRGEPVILLVVDDLSTLLAGAALELDVRCRQLPRILHTVLSEGPAAGVVVAAVVKRRDEQLRAWRHLFGTRIALRLADPAATDDVLGGGARQLGAACDRIAPPPAGTGVAWAWSRLEPAPVRIAILPPEPHARSA